MAPAQDWVCGVAVYGTAEAAPFRELGRGSGAKELVACGVFDLVDDEDGGGAFDGFQAEA